MVVYFYDRTFEGLLTAVFDAYTRKVFPELLLAVGQIPPLFMAESHTVATHSDQAKRVWLALLKKLNKNICNMLTYVWLSELEGTDLLLFRYICKTFDHTQSVAWNFADADVLEVQKIARKVGHEGQYIKQFVRFQKAADGLFFAPIRPRYNALPLTIDHFTDRFADQPWVIYDLCRKYGYHYNGSCTREITFANHDHLLSGKLNDTLMAADEKLFQDLWKSYFKALAIEERLNPRLQKQHMPVRFWKDLTEMEETKENESGD